MLGMWPGLSERVGYRRPITLTLSIKRRVIGLGEQIPANALSAGTLDTPRSCTYDTHVSAITSQCSSYPMISQARNLCTREGGE